MRFNEIGQQLRAYRLESGLRAEEIAARLGVSRAALYRYEKGEVIKLDTIQRLAELLKVSALSLLGIGMEYYSRPVAYFERLRQLEESADQILELASPLCYLTTSDSYDAALRGALDEAAAEAGADRATARTMAEQVLGLLVTRKRMHTARRPNIICILTPARLRSLLTEGIAPGAPVSAATRAMCRATAFAEVENVARLMEAEPMGLQFGLLVGAEPDGGYVILRGRERATLGVNPFRSDGVPGALTGVAMVTSADDAVAAHQRVAEAQWREATRGPAGAARVRVLLAEFAD